MERADDQGLNYNYRPRKTRIARITKDDEVLVECIAEDLQDEYEKMQDLHNAVLDIEEELFQKSKRQPDDIRRLMLKAMERDRARIKFWENVCQRYNVWHLDMSIKDGYALVRSDDGVDRILKGLFGR